jgi:transcriptional regulator with XRE-family HTH domain
MTSEQFEAWRTANGLSLRRAAKVLGLSYLTVLSYSRGYRHDDHRPVAVPETVALACEALSARASGGPAESAHRPPLAPAEPDAQLPTWGDLEPVVKRRALYALKNKPVFSKVPPKQVFLTKLDRFLPARAHR